MNVSDLGDIMGGVSGHITANGHPKGNPYAMTVPLAM